MKRVYWDTTVFLCFLSKQEISRRQICEDILQAAQRKEIEIYTSTFTIAEVIRPKHIKDTRRLTADEVATIQKMFQWSFIKKINVDQRVGFKAVETRKRAAYVASRFSSCCIRDSQGT